MHRVTDAATGNPLKGVIVSFLMVSISSKSKAANSKPDVVKKTAEKGGFNIKTMPAGMYNVTIKKNGYAEQETTMAITDGEMSELKVRLKKN